MIYAGANITSAADELKKINIDYLYNSIRFPKQKLESDIKQLRIIRQIDDKKYASLKCKLPYIVCGAFSPAFRKLENFGYIEYFIIDIDNLTDKGLNINKLKETFSQEDTILLCFVSPSGDGLKILFKLKERCYDSTIYKLFYKEFLKTFSLKYGLEQVIDLCTSDVTRACFISIDPEPIYNPDPTPIDLNTYIDISDINAIFAINKEDIKKEIETKKGIDKETPEQNTEPDNEVIQKIKNILSPKVLSSLSEKKEIYVPEELNNLISELKLYIEETGVNVYETINIQYGKKIKLKLGHKLAEINIFLGKKGYSVINSPKSGTNMEFSKLMIDLIKSYIYQ